MTGGKVAGWPGESEDLPAGNKVFLEDQGKPVLYLWINRDIPDRHQSVRVFFYPGYVQPDTIGEIT